MISAVLKPKTAAVPGQPRSVDSFTGVDAGHLIVSLRRTDTGHGVDIRVQDLVFVVTDAGHGTDFSFGGAPPTPFFPQIKLEVALGSDPTSEFQIWTTVHSDSVAKLLNFVTKSGRQDDLKQPETGTMVCTLHNQDRRFDPTYTLSPYYPNLEPVKQIRLSATWNGVTYFLHQGDAEQWPQVWDSRWTKANLQSNDGFDALSNANLTLDRPDELSGARIQAILDAAGWPSSQRDIDLGQTALRHNPELKGTAAQLIRDVVIDEDGYFFFSGDGKATFIERHQRFKPPYTTPVVTLSNRPTGGELPLSNADLQVDKDFIKNQVNLSMQITTGSHVDSETGITVEDADELEFTKDNTASQSKYRLRTLDFDSSAILLPNEAETKAEYNLDRLAFPVPRVRSVTLEPQLDPNLWPHVLGRSIGERVRVKITPVQSGTEQTIDFQGIIESISHRVEQRTWQTVWTLSPTAKNDYWILESATLGVLDTSTRLGY